MASSYSSILGKRAKHVTHPQPIVIAPAAVGAITVTLAIQLADGLKLSPEQESLWQIATPQMGQYEFILYYFTSPHSV